MSSSGRGRILVITGEPGSGKSTLCAHVVDLATAAGLRVAGVSSPPRVVDGRKVGFDLVDLASGERRPLGEARDGGRADGVEMQTWRFHAGALQWGEEVLSHLLPCDLLVIDEIGPLELEQGQGWQAAFHALDAGLYCLALVVVRPWLVPAFLQRCRRPATEVIAVSESNREQRAAELAALLPELRV